MSLSQRYLYIAMLVAMLMVAAAGILPAVSQAADRTAALELAKRSGCLACHSVTAKVVGPAWQDVSQHYQGDEGAREQLIAKVKTGGKGNWTKVTGGVPMPPYSPRVSDEDIETLVDFVLGLASE